MDYDIKIETLSSKTSELEELKVAAENIYNEFNSCYYSQINDAELIGLRNNLKEPIERLKKGHTNSNAWFKNYITELTELEDNISSFSAPNLTKPVEFKGEFVDLFGKKTMPIIKTNGDTHANAPATTPQTATSSSGELGNTQASEFYALGDAAYNEWQDYTEDSARGQWIKKVGEIVKNTNTYGIKKSLILAQIINESGWMSTHASSLSNYNNVLGINTDMGRITPDMQTSTWSQKRTSGVNTVTQWDSSGSHIIPSNESMRHYDSIEECIEDYANVVSLYHPECVGSNNLEDYRSFLEGYTPNPNGSTTDKYKGIIAKYNLEKYDV